MLSHYFEFYKELLAKYSKDNSMLLSKSLHLNMFSAPGLYITTEMLDFGILRTFDGPKTLRLNVLNSKTDPVHITVCSFHI